ncbi:MAG: D-tyrosyl-tRNA(Tyr) deacylase [Bacteroidales bacterium]|jgi:D-tyrosyl-tRNA(Tyr) deacylase|nr:D-tyrosyl-tRNA(Tyr) deacylase [Bacteroidales bacterium]
MKVVIQRVSEANVTIEGKIFGAIKTGLMILVGFENEDNREDLEWMAGKITRLRIFPDENNVMNLSVGDIDGEILLISQFTLHASTKKGNRPSYIYAANPEIAIPLYDEFTKLLESQLSKPVQTGIFGADMKVFLINDGPVTIIIDSKNKT